MSTNTNPIGRVVTMGRFTAEEREAVGLGEIKDDEIFVVLVVKVETTRIVNLMYCDVNLVPVEDK